MKKAAERTSGRLGKKMWGTWLCRLIPMTVAVSLSMAVSVFAEGWSQQGNGSWRYQSEDRSFVVNGFTPDGYFIDGSGIWWENAQVLDVKLPSRNSFLAASQAGSMTSFESMAVSLLGSIGKGCGRVRSFALDADWFGGYSVSEDGEKEIMSFYKDGAEDGYVLRLSCALSRVQGQDARVSWYDYQVIRALMHRVSRTGEQLAEAIYLSWEEGNNYGLKMGEWVSVGDALVKYEVAEGAGLYYIKANPQIP